MPAYGQDRPLGAGRGRFGDARGRQGGGLFFSAFTGVHRQFDRQRRIAAGATQQLQAVGAEAGDRVVHGANDWAVVGQEEVGDGTQPLTGVLAGNGHRLFRKIPTGTHDGLANRRHEQMV